MKPTARAPGTLLGRRFVVAYDWLFGWLAAWFYYSFEVWLLGCLVGCGVCV